MNHDYIKLLKANSALKDNKDFSAELKQASPKSNSPKKALPKKDSPVSDTFKHFLRRRYEIA
jgi:hypothetical protein